jgi:ABC-type Zn2+ transport system substrate-binding protein/surface adhesin
MPTVTVVRAAGADGVPDEAVTGAAGDGEDDDGEDDDGEDDDGEDDDGEDDDGEDDDGEDDDGEDEQAVAVSAAITIAAAAPIRPRLGMLNITLLGWVLRGRVSRPGRLRWRRGHGPWWSTG